MLCVNYRERHEFETREKQVIELFAQQVAAVIASSQLVRERQRRRFARDLHDWIKSGVRGLIMLCEAAIDAIDHGLTDIARVRLALDDIRRAAWSTLDSTNIILNKLALEGQDGQALYHMTQEVLGRYANRLMSENQPKLSLDMEENLPPMPAVLMVTLFCVVREAVINAFEHAQAQNIRVRISRADDQLLLVIDDDGRGMAADIQISKEHRGLTFMSERVKGIGGYFDLDRSKKRGLLVNVKLPLKEETDGSE